jgi:hypothetical protein
MKRIPIPRALMMLATAVLMVTPSVGPVQAARQKGSDVSTLFACGGPQVLTLRLRLAESSAEIVERTDWEAGKSEGMPAEMVPKFKTTDDCKPIDGGARLLVTSSGSGVAIVERATGKTEFYATVPNAHSAEVLPGGRVVVAASTSPTGNRLIVFDRTRNDLEIFTTPLVSAHGTHWVESERTLWALGLLELQAYELANWGSAKPSLKLRETFRLPSRGGHDLSAVPGTSRFVVTTEHEALIFDRTTGQFTRHPDIGSLVNVKSVTIHPATGRTAFTLADPPDWWTRTVRFLGPEATLTFPDDRLYKVRWLP